MSSTMMQSVTIHCVCVCVLACVYRIVFVSSGELICMLSWEFVFVHVSLSLSLRERVRFVAIMNIVVWSPVTLCEGRVSVVV